MRARTRNLTSCVHKTKKCCTAAVSAPRMYGCLRDDAPQPLTAVFRCPGDTDS